MQHKYRTNRFEKVTYLLTDDEISKFWSLVPLGDGSVDDCREWGGTRNHDGYGIFYVRSIRRNVGAHRIAWFLTCHHLPVGLFVCHQCDNPPCVYAPRHLFLGTTQDNTRDMVAKGRESFGYRGGRSRR